MLSSSYKFQPPGAVTWKFLILKALLLQRDSRGELGTHPTHCKGCFHLHGRALTHLQQYSTGAGISDPVRLLPSSHPVPSGGWGHCGSGPELPGRWAGAGTSLWDTDPHGMAACTNPLQGQSRLWSITQGVKRVSSSSTAAAV